MPEQSKVMMQDPTDVIPSWLDGEIPLSDNALTVLRKRYLLHGPDGEPAETPNQMFWRVASVVAAPDAEYGEDTSAAAGAFYRMLTSFRFMPNSPTFTGAGTPLGQLAACFVLPIHDDMGRDAAGIFLHTARGGADPADRWRQRLLLLTVASQGSPGQHQQGCSNRPGWLFAGL